MATGPASSAVKEPDDWEGVDDWQTVTPTEGAHIGAVPPLASKEGIIDRLKRARNAAINALPSIGGFAGGLIGLGAGAETGPGAVATAAAGASAGGALGEDVRQAAMERLYPKQPKMGPLEAGLRIGVAGGEQAAQEVGGQVAGKVVGRGVNALGTRFIPDSAFAKYPILKSVFAVGDKASPRAAQHLTTAASGKQGAGVTLEAVTNTIGDLEQEVGKLPPKERTVEGFLKGVNSRKDAMNNESGIAMLPIRGKDASAQGVANNIKKLIRSHMAQMQEGRQQRAYILKRASEFERSGWTYGKLDELRTDLASQLAKHNAKESVAKYTAEKGDLNLAIDNAILDGLRDTVYPEMDRAAGKPAGYFENLKGRQSSLITLQAILDKRVRDLKGSQAISEVTSPFSKENVSIYAHAGGLPRAYVHGIREAIAPTRELKAASKHVKKAFPAVNTLPYQVLFSGAIRAPFLPKTQELEQTRADQLQSNPQ